MERKTVMPRTNKVETMRVRCRVLCYLAERGAGGKRVPISYREMEQALDYSGSRVRYACRYLESCDYLRVIPCYGEDGGQRGNRYRVTRKGHNFIEAVDRWEACRV